MLEGELSDPRIAPSYVTDVVLAPGGKSARVFVAVHGSYVEEAETLEALTAARAYIRSMLRDRMGVRHIPDLTFAIDRSEKMTGRMDELLERMRKREKKSGAGATGAGAIADGGVAADGKAGGAETRSGDARAGDAPVGPASVPRPVAAEKSTA